MSNECVNFVEKLETEEKNVSTKRKYFSTFVTFEAKENGISKLSYCSSQEGLSLKKNWFGKRAKHITSKLQKSHFATLIKTDKKVIRIIFSKKISCNNL